MPLDFPASPVDGQAYDNWIYSSAKGAWLAKPLEPMAAVPSPTAPLNPTNGDMWYNTENGTTYVYYNDGSSAQWVEMVASPGFASPLAIAAGGTGAATLAGAQNNLGIGLVTLVAPTINTSGGVATANTNRVVSFSAATSISLNNIFTSDYEDYKINIKIASASTQTAIYIRYRAAGVDSTNTLYRQGFHVIRTDNTTTTITQNVDSKCYVLDVNTSGGSVSADIKSPQISNETYIHAKGMGYQSGWFASISGDGIYDGSASFDGLTMYPGTGNITGTIQVFGYEK